MTTITRRLEWDSGHRVLGYAGRCRHIHGHRYSAEITVRSPELNALGMIVDFGVIKARVGKWIDDNWDHNLLLNREDSQLSHFMKTEERKPFIMPDGNPTAENIAEVLFTQAVYLLPIGLEIVRVRIYETPSCWADYYGGENHAGIE